MRLLGQVMGMAGTLVWLTAALASAQTPTSSTETKTFEIVSVDRNELVVKLPDGTKAITVPDEFKLTVDGTPMALQALKPGMKGTATITRTTTMTPVTVTEIKEGEVVQTAASTIFVRTADGLIRSFTQGGIDKRGVKILRDGRPATIANFHAGDNLTDTIITSQPPKVVTNLEVAATLAPDAAPSAPAPPPAVGTSGTEPPSPGKAPAR